MNGYYYHSLFFLAYLLVRIDTNSYTWIVIMIFVEIPGQSQIIII